MDLSPLRKLEVLGPDAETLIQRTITRDARKLSVGQVVYTAICNETGGMIDDATVFRLGREQLPLRRRRRVRRGLAARGRRPQQPQGLDQAEHRPAPQPRRPGPAQPGRRWRDRLDPTDAAGTGRAQVVPVPRRPDQDPRRDPDHRLAHRLHGRARLRGVVPPERRPGRLGRDLGRPASHTGSSRSGSRRSTCSGSSRG